MSYAWKIKFNFEKLTQVLEYGVIKFSANGEVNSERTKEISEIQATNTNDSFSLKEHGPMKFFSISLEMLFFQKRFYESTL